MTAMQLISTDIIVGLGATEDREKAGGRESSESPAMQFLGQWASESVPAERGARGLQCRYRSGHCPEREYNRNTGSALHGL